MNRAKSICRKTNCNTLVDKPGYCESHKYLIKEYQRASFDSLKRDNVGFYNTPKWQDTSTRHRHIEPLCRECKQAGRTTLAALVHHDPELSVLLEQGLNPYDDQYLVSLCSNCHNRHLRERMKRK